MSIDVIGLSLTVILVLIILRLGIDTEATILRGDTEKIKENTIKP